MRGQLPICACQYFRSRRHPCRHGGTLRTTGQAANLVHEKLEKQSQDLSKRSTAQRIHRAQDALHFLLRTLAFGLRFTVIGQGSYVCSANLRSSSADLLYLQAAMSGPPPPSCWPSLLHTSSRKQPGRHRNRRVLRNTSSPAHRLTRPQAAVRDSTSTTLRFIYLSSSARQPQLCFTTATGPCSSAYRIPQARNFCTYRTIPCRRRHPELPAK